MGPHRRRQTPPHATVDPRRQRDLTRRHHAPGSTSARGSRPADARPASQNSTSDTTVDSTTRATSRVSSTITLSDRFRQTDRTRRARAADVGDTFPDLFAEGPTSGLIEHVQQRERERMVRTAQRPFGPPSRKHGHDVRPGNHDRRGPGHITRARRDASLGQSRASPRPSTRR